MRIKSLIIVACFFSSNIFAQTEDFNNYLNTITTSAPFLIISPDARAGGMGDIGVATSPDPMSMHWNPAKYAFMDDEFGVSVCYTPWLKALIPDINLSYLSGYTKISDREAVALSLRYFSLGVINFTNSSGEDNGSFNPNEFAITSSYSLKLSNNFSTSIALRYVYSNLTGRIYTEETGQTKPGTTVAGDISAFYTNEVRLFGNQLDWSTGLNISNIGNKITYTNEDEADFIPTNLRLGTAFSSEIDDFNKVSFSIELNKLLVPTPPLRDQEGNIILGEENEGVPVVSGIFQSFSDAPYGFKEEWREIIWAGGLEYWYADQFAVRSGYFFEHKSKGDRKFFTLGAGLRYNVFGLDFSYLIPMRNRDQAGTTNPLANTIRFALTFDFGALNNKVNSVPSEG